MKSRDKSLLVGQSLLSQLTDYKWQDSTSWASVSPDHCQYLTGMRGWICVTVWVSEWCVNVCVYKWECVCLHVWLLGWCESESVYVCECGNIYVGMCDSASVHVSMFAGVWLPVSLSEPSVCVSVTECEWICVGVSVWWICVPVWVYMGVNGSEWVSESTYMWVTMCLSNFACLWAWVTLSSHH